MNTSRALFFLGFAIGAFLSFWLTVIGLNSPSSKIYRYNKAIELCEQDLPRTQHCKITAIPVESK